MKTLSPASFLASLLLAGVCAGCQSQVAPMPTAQATSKPKYTKEIEVGVSTTNPSFSSRGQVSFDAGPSSKTDVAIGWDGNRFTSRTDSGTVFWSFSPGVAFQNKRAAYFNVKKVVTIRHEGNIQKTVLSDVVLIKRGVPATL